MKNSLLLLLLISPFLLADKDSDENRLLKSWGFQFDAQGILVFNAISEVEGKSDYQPWNPDFTGSRVTQPYITPPQILDPLIIGSKDKTE